MQPPCCQSFSDALGQVQKSTATTGQPTGEWLLCQTSALIESSSTDTILLTRVPESIESAWSQLKLGQKRRKGLMRKDLQSYLDERMWRQWRAGDINVSMRNFLAILPLQYRTDTPVLWGSPCGYDICCFRFVYCMQKEKAILILLTFSSILIKTSQLWNGKTISYTQ